MSFMLSCGTRVSSRECTAVPATCRPPRITPLGVSAVITRRSCTASSGADVGPQTQPAGDPPSYTPPTSSDSSEPKSLMTKIGNWIFGGPLDKERIKSLGLGALLAYGFVSNVTYGACCTICWASHVAATGMTPFSGGQFGPFLARAAGLLALQQLLRPIRFSCAMALTPFVDRMLSWLQKRMGVSRSVAFYWMFAGLAAGTLAGFTVALTAVTVWNMPK